MTEADWLACDNPDTLVHFFRASAKFTDRKMRLFAAALCRLDWDLLTDERSRRAVEVVEWYADGNKNDAELASAFGASRSAAVEQDTPAAWLASYALSSVARDGWHLSRSQRAADGQNVRSRQANVFRDIFGNPFNLFLFDRRWRTSDSVGVARGIYDDRAFDRLPILSDALLDAGCENPLVIEHCRSAGPHFRGCFVVDLVLNKK